MDDEVVGPMYCTRCPFAVTSASHEELAEHWTSHQSPYVLFKCDKCTLQFRNEIEFRFHVSSHFKRLMYFKCDLCTKESRIEDEIIAHRASSHPNAPPARPPPLKPQAAPKPPLKKISESKPIYESKVGSESNGKSSKELKGAEKESQPLPTAPTEPKSSKPLALSALPTPPDSESLNPSNKSKTSNNVEILDAMDIDTPAPPKPLSPPPTPPRRKLERLLDRPTSTQPPPIPLNSSAKTTSLTNPSKSISKEPGSSQPFLGSDSAHSELVVEIEPPSDNLETSSQPSNPLADPTTDIRKLLDEISNDLVEVSEDLAAPTPPKPSSRSTPQTAAKPKEEESSSGSEGFQCEFCEKSFETEKALRGHKTRYHDVAPTGFQCENCTFKSQSQKYFERHLIAHSPTSSNVLCQKCGVVFNEVSGYRGHYSKSHNEPAPPQIVYAPPPTSVQKPIRQPIIKPSSEPKKSEQASEVQPAKSFLCPKCDKTFPTSASLQSHLESHSKVINLVESADIKEASAQPPPQYERVLDNRFKCKICGDVLDTETGLMRHFKGNHSDVRLEIEKPKPPTTEAPNPRKRKRVEDLEAEIEESNEGNEGNDPSPVQKKARKPPSDPTMKGRKADEEVIEPSNSYKCFQCPQIFTSRIKYERHVMEHINGGH